MNELGNDLDVNQDDMSTTSSENEEDEDTTSCGDPNNHVMVGECVVVKGIATPSASASLPDPNNYGYSSHHQHQPLNHNNHQQPHHHLQNYPPQDYQQTVENSSEVHNFNPPAYQNSSRPGAAGTMAANGDNGENILQMMFTNPDMEIMPPQPPPLPIQPATQQLLQPPRLTTAVMQMAASSAGSGEHSTPIGTHEKNPLMKGNLNYIM